MSNGETPQCFVARPVGDHGTELDRYGDRDHWKHVEQHLIAPALDAAGYSMVPPEAGGAVLIHGNIIHQLESAQLVLADFSGLNANVLFEAGVRTSVNKPLVIIAEEGTALPFDTTGINTWFYQPELRPWNVARQCEQLAQHIRSTPQSGNALWSKFGMQTRAADLDTTASPEDARIQVLTDVISSLATDIRRLERATSDPAASQNWGNFQPYHVESAIRDVKEAISELAVTPDNGLAWARSRASLQKLTEVRDGSGGRLSPRLLRAITETLEEAESNIDVIERTGITKAQGTAHSLPIPKGTV